MQYDPAIHHRRSIRLKGYDYSQAGVYFVTICAQNRECLFGEIVDGKMQWNEAGRMAMQWFGELENKFTDLRCDEFIIMPNHAHFVVVNAGTDMRESGQTHRSAPTENWLAHVVQWFKTMTTNKYIRGVKQHGWPPFPGKLWQRNYWEHVIRDEAELNSIREYIQNNPAQWQFDQLHVPINL